MKKFLIEWSSTIILIVGLSFHVFYLQPKHTREAFNKGFKAAADTAVAMMQRELSSRDTSVYVEISKGDTSITYSFKH